MRIADKLVLDYFLLPVFIVAMCGLILATGYEDDFHPVDNLIAVFIFLVIGAFGYQVGYKRYLKDGRSKYFYAIFVTPAVVTALIYLVGLVLV